MMLIKDTKTGSKSITITCLVITFLLTAASCIINLVILAKGGEPQMAQRQPNKFNFEVPSAKDQLILQRRNNV